MKKLQKRIIIVCVLSTLIGLGITFSNSYFGWYGYEKYKYRRITFGNREESIKRKVFIRDLEFNSNVDLDCFRIYIEKGFKYGYHGSTYTTLIEKSNYPYQISYKFLDSIKLISYEVSNKSKYDSVDNTTIFLKKPELIDTLNLKVFKYSSKKWDSIGFIRVWEKNN